MREFFIDYCQIKEPIPNVWIGVSTENQEQANKRIPILLEIPAAVRFVSVEPMLGIIGFMLPLLDNDKFQRYNVLKGKYYTEDQECSGVVSKPKLDWVICGGESGSKARPMHPNWVRSLRDYCKDAGTPFFFKQWGEWLPFDGGKDPDNYFPTNYRDVVSINKKGEELITREEQLDHGLLLYKVGKKKAGRLLDGVEHNEYPTLKNQ